MSARLAFFVAVHLGLGCAMDGWPTPGIDPDDPPIADAEELFSLARLPTFSIELDDEAWATLDENPRDYVSGTFIYGDQTEERVGIRLKGHNTMTPLDQKPSFKIKFNKFEKGRRFLGLEVLTLNNLHADPSMLREHISYKMFRELGLPASRTGYARLFVNGDDYGLYLNLENLDDEFLAYNFTDPSGNLYEGEVGDDVHRDSWAFEQDEGQDESRSDLVRLRETATADDLRVIYSEDSLLDPHDFLGFIATEHAIGHFDGYMAPHNYFLYFEPSTERFTFIPWSLDQTLRKRSSMFEGDGYLTRKCLFDAQCLAEYVEISTAIADRIAQLDLQREMDDVLDLIDTAALDDGRKRHTTDEMRQWQDSIRVWADERPDEMRKELDCLDGNEEIDADGDGFGACFRDCDDADPDTNPFAAEICDGKDNNCSGYADSHVACKCPDETVQGISFYFCDLGMTWAQAAEFCAAQGHELAIFDDPGQEHAVWAYAQERSMQPWSIGLTDATTEGEYRWVDGTSPAYESWPGDEPSPSPSSHDCVELVGDDAPTWRESDCHRPAPFICSDVG